MLKRLMYTSDPHEPSGTIGIYETEEQRNNIIKDYIKDCLDTWPELGEKYFRDLLFEKEIEIGVYYP